MDHGICNDTATHDGVVPLSAPAAVGSVARSVHVRRRPLSLRVAVVGCGYWGSKHVRVLSAMPGVSGVALVERDPVLRASMQAAFPAARAFGSLLKALPHVDAVVIATPPQSHAKLATVALRAGLPVLVEKPLATSLAEGRALVEEARRSRAVLMVGHTFQFNPAVRELRQRIAAGELGQIYYIHSARLNLGMSRPDVNVIWDLAPHDISILNYLLAATPVAATAWGASLASGSMEDLAYIRLEYESPRVTGYAHLSWLDPRKTRSVTVVGSKKMAVYDDLAEERLRIYDRGVNGVGDGPVSHERPLTYRYGDIVSPHISAEEPLAVQDGHFVGSVLAGTVPEGNGEESLAIVATLEMISRSLQYRTRVPVQSVPFAGEDPVEASAITVLA